MQALTNAKSNLRADKNELQTAYNKLIGERIYQW